MEWTNEMVVTLIEEYESYPALWDPNCPEYKDRERKAGAWRQLADCLGVDVAEVHRKIHNLRNQWNAEHRKMSARTVGPGGVEYPRTKWSYYDALSFIRSSVESRRGKTSMVEVVMGDGDDDAPKAEPGEGHNHQPTTRPPSAAVSARRKAREEYNLLAAARLIQAAEGSKKEPLDEFSTFGEHVASELRQVGDRQALAVAKHKINTVLFEAATGKYSQHHQYTY